MAKFEPAFIKAMVWEGGKADDAADPGGRTYKGITQRSWDEFCKTWNQPTKDVWELTDEQVFSFYMMTYWIPLRGKLIKSQALANVLFSMAILQGKKPAVRRLQRLLYVPTFGAIVTDGVMGAQTLAVIDKQDPIKLIKDYKTTNIVFFEWLATKRPASQKFLAGWKNRINSYEAVA